MCVDREDQLQFVPLALAVVGLLKRVLPERKQVDLREHIFHHFLDGGVVAVELLYS